MAKLDPVIVPHSVNCLYGKVGKRSALTLSPQRHGGGGSGLQTPRRKNRRMLVHIIFLVIGISGIYRITRGHNTKCNVERHNDQSGKGDVRRSFNLHFFYDFLKSIPELFCRHHSVLFGRLFFLYSIPCCITFKQVILIST